jgi:hypothetical protein
VARRRVVGGDADGLGETAGRPVSRDLDGGGAVGLRFGAHTGAGDGRHGDTRPRGDRGDRTGMRWLEWSLPDDKPLDDFRAIKRCKSAAYITVGLLREQAQRVAEIAFAQFHCCRWGVGEGTWLPAGAWSACAGDWAPEDVPVVLGVDIGGTRSSSALVGVTTDLQVAEVHVYTGDDAVLEIVDRIVEIASRRPVLEVVHDPARFISDAMRLNRDHRCRR